MVNVPRSKTPAGKKTNDRSKARHDDDRDRDELDAQDNTVDSEGPADLE